MNDRAPLDRDALVEGLAEVLAQALVRAFRAGRLAEWAARADEDGGVEAGDTTMTDERVAGHGAERGRR